MRFSSYARSGLLAAVLLAGAGMLPLLSGGGARQVHADGCVDPVIDQSCQTSMVPTSQSFQVDVVDAQPTLAGGLDLP